MYPGRTNYLDGRKSQFVRRDKILFFIIADINHTSRYFVQTLDDPLKTGRRWLPALSAKLFGIDDDLDIVFDFEGPDLELLGRQKSVRKQGECIF